MLVLTVPQLPQLCASLSLWALAKSACLGHESLKRLSDGQLAQLFNFHVAIKRKKTLPKRPATAATMLTNIQIVVVVAVAFHKHLVHWLAV